MAEYTELTEEFILAMRAGARAIASTKRYQGTIFVSDVFSENPKEIPYLKAAEILYAASEKEPADVTPVRHGRWLSWDALHGCNTPAKNVLGVFCSECIRQSDSKSHFCPNCGAKMDGDESQKMKR